MHGNEKNIIGFFVAKKLLNDPKIAAKDDTKLDVSEVLSFGIDHEPRILVMLPTALIHYPDSFIGIEKAPEELLSALEHIKAGEEKGPDLFGTDYSEMKDWVDCWSANTSGARWVKKILLK